MDRTQLAGTRTNLALTRSAMAAERTLMAWIRTCLAMISFGFTIGKLEDVLASAKVNVAFGRTADIAGVAYFLVCLGTVALILAAVQYRLRSRASPPWLETPAQPGARHRGSAEPVRRVRVHGPGEPAVTAANDRSPGGRPPGASDLQPDAD